MPQTCEILYYIEISVGYINCSDSEGMLIHNQRYEIVKLIT